MLISRSAAKRKMWKLKSFGSLRNINKTGNKFGGWWSNTSSSCLCSLLSLPRVVRLTCVFCVITKIFLFSPSHHVVFLVISVVLNFVFIALPFSNYGFITPIVLIHGEFVVFAAHANLTRVCSASRFFFFFLQRKRTQTLSWCRSPGRRGTLRPRAWRTGTPGWPL